MMRILFWAIASTAAAALLVVLSYNSARMRNGSVSAIPEWVIKLGASIVASAIGFGFMLAKYDLAVNEIPLWMAFLLPVATIAGGIALFCIAAGAQETKSDKLKRILEAERAALLAKRHEQNERFMKNLLEEDLSDVEIEDLVPAQPALTTDDQSRKLFHSWTVAELSRL